MDTIMLQIKYNNVQNYILDIQTSIFSPQFVNL